LGRRYGRPCQHDHAARLPGHRRKFVAQLRQWRLRAQRHHDRAGLEVEHGHPGLDESHPGGRAACRFRGIRRNLRGPAKRQPRCRHDPGLVGSQRQDFQHHERWRRLGHHREREHRVERGTLRRLQQQWRSLDPLLQCQRRRRRMDGGHQDRSFQLQQRYLHHRGRRLDQHQYQCRDPARGSHLDFHRLRFGGNSDPRHDHFGDGRGLVQRDGRYRRNAAQRHHPIPGPRDVLSPLLELDGWGGFRPEQHQLRGPRGSQRMGNRSGRIFHE
jgi:hypothetical protein